MVQSFPRTRLLCNIRSSVFGCFFFLRGGRQTALRFYPIVLGGLLAVALFSGNLAAQSTQSFSNQGTAVLSIRLKPVAIIQTLPIRLSDLGQLDANSRNLSDKVVLESLEKPIFITDDQLKKALASSGIQGAVYGKGVWLLPLPESMTAAETSEFFEGILENSIQGQGTYKVEARKGILYNSHLKSLIKFSGLHDSRAGQRNVTVDFLDPENSKRILFRQTVPVRVLKKIHVPVAQKNLKSGETIREGDYRMEERYSDGKLTDYSGENIHGWKLTAPAQKGQVLQAPTIQELPDVRRGQSMDLIYQKPGIVLKIRCVAYGDGNVGDRIKVRILAFQNRTVIKEGRIVSDGSVVYEP